MTTDIETERYLDSLPEGILTLNISGRRIKSLTNLTRFKNLQFLDCSRNNLTYLPTLPQNLTELHCYRNQLSSLPTLPPNLEVLACSENTLTLLPTLPKNLEALYCSNNQLTYLPTLPENLKRLYCYYNQLTSLPNLPQNLEILHCHYNPIYEIVVNSNDLFQTKQNIQEFNNRRHLDYCLQYKNQFRKWLWEKVREPKIKKLYHPNYLIEKLGDEDDLDAVIDNWEDEGDREALMSGRMH